MSEFQVFGIIISLLLSVVAFFTKQLHRDFKHVEKDVSEMKNTTSLIKTEFKGINELMNQKIEFLEKRINHFESTFFNQKFLYLSKPTRYPHEKIMSAIASDIGCDHRCRAGACF